ncbi:MAG: UDP-glucose/GDP-mannose dehydrogenase family protein [Candidatus Undinarchaeales archaeon]|jgi:UDPglucose 6-dehydrogenase|nr:UDP-glucose/GDP-mannose dehydrogenase family protein [Candidatus Undinarchaeales archaeon]
MKIAVIGTGYVGLITGVGLASKGHQVSCVDVIEKKVDQINKGIPPIYEEDLEEMLKDVLKKGKFNATLDAKQAILDSDVTFICVGTPSKDDGSIDLSYVETAAKSIGEALKEKDGYSVVIMKSTVLPGTTEKVLIPALEKESGKKAGEDFGVCMTPEFLREGKAIEDFLNPDRVIVGQVNDKAGNVAKRLHETKDRPFLRTNLRTAEMIKYASNAFLATKISFINEIGNICKELDINTIQVARGMGMDHRISPHFLRPGAGFGGSCFPKDVEALIHQSKDELKYNPEIIQSAMSLNEKQPLRLVELAERKIGELKGKTVAILGLAFKSGTDDMRESRAVPVINALLEKGVTIHAYDPKASENAKKIFGDKISYEASINDALKDADFCMIVTEWSEFKNIDFSAMKEKIVFDGRNILESRDGIDYNGLCW